MIFLFELSLPFTDPVLVFSVVLFIIFFAPILFRKLRVPGLIGLIVSGVIAGPNGVNLLLRNSSIVLFGTVGLLYIMFLAGLEIDISEFKKSKHKSLVFGACTFLIPLTLGTSAAYFIIGLSFQSSILLGNMLASHTLVSFPIASKLGITKNEAVTTAIGGTIITDTTVLLILAVITGSAKGHLNLEFWIRLIVSISIFAFVVLWGFTRITKWFFRNVQEDGGAQYIFVLGIVFASAFLAEVAGVEPVIGAFFAGLALNRLIPRTSPLMNRVEFIGNTLFIPFFLISVGMIVDLRVLVEGYETLLVAGVLVSVSLLSKWLAAFITQKVFRYSPVERNLIFGLSSSHAAATLAVILVGYDLKLVDETILNGAVLLILVSCLVSSFVTENAGRSFAVAEASKKPEAPETPDRILVPIANPAYIEQKIDLAVMLKDENSGQPIYALTIVKDDEDAREKVLFANKMLERAIVHASLTENQVHVVPRIELNIANGIARTIRELVITEVILGWNGKSSAAELIFGSVLDGLLEKTTQTILVTKIIHPLNTLKRVIVLAPPNAELEIGFRRWIKVIGRLAKQTGSDVHIYGEKKTLERIKNVLADLKMLPETKYIFFEEWHDFMQLSKKINTDDLFILVSARKGTLSYNVNLDAIPRMLSKHFSRHSFIIVYPEQYSVDMETRHLQLEGMNSTPIQEDIERINKLGRVVKKIFRNYWKK